MQKIVNPVRKLHPLTVLCYGGISRRDGIPPADYSYAPSISPPDSSNGVKPLVPVKEREQLSQVLNNFRASLVNAGIYFHDHPFFRKSAEKFHRSLLQLFESKDQVAIGITPQGLVIEDNRFEKEKISQALARHFHQRKIKKIVFIKGLSIEDIVMFLQIVSKPVREINDQGGLLQLVANAKLRNISVEELDYSRILQNKSGKEVNDIWSYIIADSGQAQIRKEEVDLIAFNLDLVMGDIQFHDLKDDPQLNNKITQILQYVKAKSPEKYQACTKSYLKLVMKDPAMLQDQTMIQEIKEFVKEIDSETLCESLWEDTFETKKIDSLTFSLFTRMLDLQTNKEVARGLGEKFEQTKISYDKNTRAKIQKLFSGVEQGLIDSAYRDTLQSFLKQIDHSGSGLFERETIASHFWSLLLNLLVIEDEEATTYAVITQLSKEWNAVLAGGDFNFILSCLLELRKRFNDKTRSCFLSHIQEVYEKMFMDLEMVLLDENTEIDFKEIYRIVSVLEISRISPSIYIKKMMRCGSNVEKLMWVFKRLHPNHIEDFLIEIRKSIQNKQGLKNAIDLLKILNVQDSFFHLKKLYYESNPFFKLEVIRAMQVIEYEYIQEDFVFSLIDGTDLFQKKEAIRIFSRAPQAVQEEVALRLLKIFNPFGMNNKRVRQNIGMILDAPLLQSRVALEKYLQSFHFWWEKRNIQFLKKVIERLQ